MIPSFQQFNEGQQFTTTKGAEMAKLEYDKTEAENSGSGVTTLRVAGTWPFVITDAKEITAKTGTKGINVTMEVDQDGTLLKSFDSFWLSEKALFRLKDASVACGKDLPDEDTDLIGWSGTAIFSVNEKGYFDVEKYVVASGEVAKAEGASFKAPSKDW